MIRFEHPCPVDGCTTTLIGEVALKVSRAASLNECGNPVLNVRPQFPVAWSAETVAHIEAHK